MRVLSIICLLCLSSVCTAQVPQGTARTVPGQGRSETYYSSNGQYLGRSVPNTQGGRTYSNQYQYSSRSVQTYNGGQRYYNTTPPNMGGSARPYSGGYGAFNKTSSKGKK